MPSRPSTCPGPTRREALALGAFGLTLPQLLAARESSTGRRPKSCIVLFLLGAPPQQETWDPKPDSPAEARGDLGVIRTAPPAVIMGETMARTMSLPATIRVLAHV